jgi:hypothetical protein
VDVFDNLVPLVQLADAALFEPIPLRPTPKPPVIPDKVNLKSKDALVVIQDIYAGDGLRACRAAWSGVAVVHLSLRVPRHGRLLGVVGADGPWDPKRVLGTVPVYADGSAKFRVPANTPISMQPLTPKARHSVMRSG